MKDQYRVEMVRLSPGLPQRPEAAQPPGATPTPPWRRVAETSVLSHLPLHQLFPAQYRPLGAAGFCFSPYSRFTCSFHS